MRISDLKWRVQVHLPVADGHNEANEPVVTYEPLATVWAQKVQLSAGERVGSDQRYAQRLVMFRIRPLSRLTEEARLVCDGLTYEVRSISEIGYREGQEVIAEWLGARSNSACDA